LSLAFQGCSAEPDHELASEPLAEGEASEAPATMVPERGSESKRGIDLGTLEQALGGAGARCGVPGASPCDLGLFCVSRVCTPLGREGAACGRGSATAPCDLGFFCASQVCRALGVRGSACGSPSNPPCGLGLRCVSRQCI
jgi:hypothetical protein